VPILTLIAMCASIAIAQEAKRLSFSRLPFCPPQTCLYYAGDFDSHSSNANGLFNANSSGIGEGQVWVGVKPTENVTVTGATFNECMAMGVETGVNPTPFEVQVGIKPGHAGKTVCRAHGTATAKSYQFDQICDQASFTIKKLSSSCKLSRNKTYFINLLPTYNDNNYGFLSDVEDKPAQNHVGWKNLWDESYFNSVSFGETYEPAWGSGGACSGLGCDAFSIALTGARR
jgi:hypothetical protein